eukprot:TRINITY_DN16408_c0_g1_i3.p1 TRINITY_DN16408_c0_g1~~TRINITY_DN16408_c0_g1_i3.p1  ORF type:complete len:769 (-),score=204.94 TRINITY_DN16408_c0_g1_i3:20-2326(-)
MVATSMADAKVKMANGVNGTVAWMDEGRAEPGKLEDEENSEEEEFQEAMVSLKTENGHCENATATLVSKLRESNSKLQGKIGNMRQQRADCMKDFWKQWQELDGEKQALSGNLEALRGEQRQLRNLARHQESEHELGHGRLKEKQHQRKEFEDRIRVLMDRLVTLLSTGEDNEEKASTEASEELADSIDRLQGRLGKIQARLECEKQENREMAVRLSGEQVVTKRLHDDFCKLQGDLFAGRSLRASALSEAAGATPPQQAKKSRRPASAQKHCLIGKSPQSKSKSSLRGPPPARLPASGEEAKSGGDAKAIPARKPPVAAVAESGGKSSAGERPTIPTVTPAEPKAALPANGGDSALAALKVAQPENGAGATISAPKVAQAENGASSAGDSQAVSQPPPPVASSAAEGLSRRAHTAALEDQLKKVLEEFRFADPVVRLQAGVYEFGGQRAYLRMDEGGKVAGSFDGERWDTLEAFIGELPGSVRPRTLQLGELSTSKGTSPPAAAPPSAAPMANGSAVSAALPSSAVKATAATNASTTASTTMVAPPPTVAAVAVLSTTFPGALPATTSSSGSSSLPTAFVVPAATTPPAGSTALATASRKAPDVLEGGRTFGSGSFTAGARRALPAAEPPGGGPPGRRPRSFSPGVARNGTVRPGASLSNSAQQRGSPTTASHGNGARSPSPEATKQDSSSPRAGGFFAAPGPVALRGRAESPRRTIGAGIVAGPQRRTHSPGAYSKTAAMSSSSSSRLATGGLLRPMRVESFLVRH